MTIGYHVALSQDTHGDSLPRRWHGTNVPAGGMLDGGDLLPGFAADLANIFA
jgi:hypothetical protein